VARLPGANHLDAIRALENAGFGVVRQEDRQRREQQGDQQLVNPERRPRREEKVGNQLLGRPGLSVFQERRARQQEEPGASQIQRRSLGQALSGSQGMTHPRGAWFRERLAFSGKEKNQGLGGPRRRQYLERLHGCVLVSAPGVLAMHECRRLPSIPRSQLRVVSPATVLVIHSALVVPGSQPRSNIPSNLTSPGHRRFPLVTGPDLVELVIFRTGHSAEADVAFPNSRSRAATIERVMTRCRCLLPQLCWRKSPSPIRP